MTRSQGPSGSGSSIRPRRISSQPSWRALNTISGLESSPVIRVSRKAIEQPLGGLRGAEAELEDPRRARTGSPRSSALELVVAGDVGADHLRVGLRGEVELARGARRLGSPASLISVGESRWRLIQPLSSRGSRPARATASDSSSRSSPERSTLGGHELRVRAAAGRRRGSRSRAPPPATRCGSASRESSPARACAALPTRRVPVAVEAREVDQPGTDDEELRSPYVTEGELDLGAWAHDALVLAMPQQLLCRPDCAGLCPVCGESLNDAAAGSHDHPREPDPRWAKLRGEFAERAAATIPRPDGRPEETNLLAAARQAPSERTPRRSRA